VRPPLKMTNNEGVLHGEEGELHGQEGELHGQEGVQVNNDESPYDDAGEVSNMTFFLWSKKWLSRRHGRGHCLSGTGALN
jgi:hypothetical protein